MTNETNFTPAQLASPFMQAIAAVPTFLRLVAAGASSIFTGSPVVGQVLTAGAALIELGEAGAADFQALTLQVEDMVTAGRTPTPAEWDALKARSDAAHEAIQNAPDADPGTAAAQPVAPAQPAAQTEAPTTEG